MKITTKLTLLNNPPKVLVGTPIIDTLGKHIERYLDAVRSLTYKQYDVVLVDNSEGDAYAQRLEQIGVKVLRSPHLPNVYERLPAARNVLRQYALENNYDYFLCLEQDTIPPKDVIERLMRHKKVAVVGVYYKKFTIHYQKEGKPVSTQQERRPMIYGFPPKGAPADAVSFCTEKDVEGNKLARIRGSGFGCVFLHRIILERFPFHTNDNKTIFDDIALSNDLFDAGIPMYVDTSVKCAHLEEGKYEGEAYDKTFQQGKFKQQP